MVWTIIAAVLLIAIGVAAFLKPDAMWKLTEQWKTYDNAEPSNVFRACIKYGGLLFALLGFLCVTILLIPQAYVIKYGGLLLALLGFVYAVIMLIPD